MPQASTHSWPVRLNVLIVPLVVGGWCHLEGCVDESSISLDGTETKPVVSWFYDEKVRCHGTTLHGKRRVFLTIRVQWSEYRASALPHGSQNSTGYRRVTGGGPGQYDCQPQLKAPPNSHSHRPSLSWLLAPATVPLLCPPSLRPSPPRFPPPPALTVPGTQCCSTTFTICRISEVGRHCCEDIAIPLGSPCARATHQAWWLAREFCVFSSGGLPSRSQLPKLAVTTLPHNSERGGTQKIGNGYTK